jgi:hypothetical protein
LSQEETRKTSASLWALLIVVVWGIYACSHPVRQHGVTQETLLYAGLSLAVLGALVVEFLVARIGFLRGESESLGILGAATSQPILMSLMFGGLCLPVILQFASAEWAWDQLPVSDIRLHIYEGIILLSGPYFCVAALLSRISVDLRQDGSKETAAIEG